MKFANMLWIASGLLVLSGCAGESTHDKMMRMARERANINAAEKEQNEAEPPQQKPAPDAAPGEPAPVTPNPDPSKPSADAELAKSEATAPNEVPTVESPAPVQPQRSQTPRERSDEPPASAVVAAPSASEAEIPETLVKFVPGGQRVAFVGKQDSIGLFDIGRNRLARQIYNPELKPISIAVDQRGNLIAVGGEDGHWKVFTLGSVSSYDKFQQNRLMRRDAMPPRKAHDHPITAVAIGELAGLAVSGDTTGEIKLWRGGASSPIEFETGDEAIRLLVPVNKGRSILGASDHQVLHWLYDGEGATRGPLNGLRLDQEISAMAASPDGSTIAVGDASGRVTTFTLEADQSPREQSFPACTSRVSKLAFDSDGNSLVTVSQSGEVARWKFPIQEQVQFSLVQPSQLLIASPDARLAGMSSHQRNLDLYAIPAASPVRRHTVNSGKLSAADFASNSPLVALGNDDGRIFFHDDAKNTLAYMKCDTSAVVQIARSTGADGRYAFVTAAGKVGVASFPGKATSPIAVQGEVGHVSNDGACLVLARGGQLHCISLKDAKITTSATIDDDEVTAIWNSDQKAVIGTQQGSLWAWDFGDASAKPMALRSSAHNSAVRALTVKSNGETISCDEQGVVLVTPSSAASSETPVTDSNPTASLTLSPKPSAIVAGSDVLVAAAGSSLISYDGGGGESQPIEISDATLRLLAVHQPSNQIAAYDDSGRLWIRPDASESPKSIGLPIKDVVSLVWSEDGSRVTVTNGNRLVTVEVASATVESQCVIDVTALTLVRWVDDDLWLIDSKFALRRLQLPRIRWEVSLGEEGSGIAWSSDGKLIAALTRGGTVVRLESASGSESAKVATGQNEARSLVAIPGTGEFGFLASNADAMYLTEDGRVDRLPISSAIGIRELSISHDGRYLYTVNALGKIVAWDRRLDSPTGIVVPCDISCERLLPLNQNYLMATSGDESKAAVIPNSQLSEFTLRVSAPPDSIVLASDGSLAGFADDSESVKLFPLDGSKRRELSQSGLTFQRLSISHDGTRVATLAKNDQGEKLLLLWDAEKGEVLAQCSLSADPKTIEYASDAALVAVSFADGHCAVFDGESAKLLESTPAENGLQAFAFASDREGLIVSDQEGVVSLEPLLALGHAQTDQNAIVSIEILAGQPPRLLVCSRDGRITLWNSEDLTAPRGELEGISGPLVTSRMSPDRRYLSVLYEDPENTVCVWKVADLSDGADSIQPVFKIHNAGPASCVAFTNDSQFLLVGNHDGSVSAWSVSDKRVVTTFSRHGGPVADIQASDEPGKFLSAGEDQTVLAGQFPAVIPPADAAAPRESMIEIMALVDLKPPKALEQDFQDPNEAAREALVAGATTSAVLDLIGGDKAKIGEAKKMLSRIMALESGSQWNASELSKLRRELAESQRRLAPDANARSLASFADGFSNLAFAADTNFKFGQDNEFRPVQLLFSDRFLYAARTSSSRPQQRWRPGDPLPNDGDNGALLSWDYRYSRLQAHAWSIEDMAIRELFPLPNSAGVFTVPQMLLFSQDGSSREFPKAASWAYSDLPESSRQFLAVGTEGALQTESDIMKVFDVADLSQDIVAPLSQYRGFEGVVTAMAFANNSPNIAFCVRGRAVHRLFIADAETLELQKLEEFDHESPWVKYDEDSRMMLRTNAAPGITSLAFSPDDKILVAHGHYSGAIHKFSQWSLQWDENNRLASAKKSPKELENDGAPLIQESGSKSIWFVKSPGRQAATDSPDTTYPRLSASSQYRVLVRVTDGFMTVNLNSNREEQKIDFLTTQHKVPLYSITDDGRWLIMGDDSGLAYIWDTIEGDRFSVTIDPDTEATLRDPEKRLKNLRERPAHTGPIAGVALSEPDAGRDYPAFAATFGEENKVKVWELYPILDPENGLRSRNVARYPVSRAAKP